MIPSALRNAVSSLAATARQASSDGDVYVDVVERVSLKVDAQGKIELFRIQGQIVVEVRLKSWAFGAAGGGGGQSAPRIKLYLPEDTFIETKEDHHITSASSDQRARPDGSTTTASVSATAVNRGFTGATTVLTNCSFHPFCEVIERKPDEREGELRKPEMIVSVANGEKIQAFSYQ